MSFAVKTEGLGKKYLIGHQRQERYETLRDMLAHKARGLGQRLRHPLSPNAEQIELEELWALRGVDLEIQQGEKVGIIGRNGAGKTTLLKLLSRITEPSEGKFTINGRVSSLLEVGTGFHPELTGRENIFLNGAILGMSRAEIRSRFDEIVDFAEVERFLDTPVKRYSSGMYVRLAFAVAAHLEPEILIVDEVLAVGDVKFQRKCLGRMDQIGKEGRTLLFVSHQLDMVRALCSRAVLLNEGMVIAEGMTDQVIDEYEDMAVLAPTFAFETQSDLSLPIQVTRATVKDEKGNPRVKFDVFEPICLEFEYQVRVSRSDLVVNFELKRSDQTVFMSFDTDCLDDNTRDRKLGGYAARVVIPPARLKPGNYSLDVRTGIINTSTFQHVANGLSFEVELNSQPSALLSCAGKRAGLVPGIFPWETESLDGALLE
jgi:lipopolysaccharide transport system ATP-binding protein